MPDTPMSPDDSTPAAPATTPEVPAAVDVNPSLNDMLAGLSMAKTGASKSGIAVADQRCGLIA
ncbi:MAG: hypothetical protein V4532_19680, partial [Pseudomonadota bacterium]